MWPWLWTDPINNFQQSISFWTYEPQEYFLGTLGVVPNYYYLIYFFATMPILLSALFFFSIKQYSSKNVFIKILLIWFFFSLLVFSLNDFRQNGTRYIISIYPAFAILAALGLSELFKNVKKLDKFTLVILILIFADLGYIMFVSHPYYLDYYNEIVGGPSTVYNLRLFNIGWQGEGVGEAVNYLNQNAPVGSTIEFHVVPSHTEHRLRDDLIEVNPPVEDELLRLSEIEIDHEFHDADYAVVNTYFEWYFNETFTDILESNSFEIVQVIDAQNAPLVKIYKK